jgi:hypothetical protein
MYMKIKWQRVSMSTRLVGINQHFPSFYLWLPNIDSLYFPLHKIKWKGTNIFVTPTRKYVPFVAVFHVFINCIFLYIIMFVKAYTADWDFVQNVCVCLYMCQCHFQLLCSRCERSDCQKIMNLIMSKHMPSWLF